MFTITPIFTSIFLALHPVNAYQTDFKSGIQQQIIQVSKEIQAEHLNHLHHLEVLKDSHTNDRLFHIHGFGVSVHHSSSSNGNSFKETVTTSIQSGVDWNKLAQCESSGDWSADTGNGFFGGVQFTESTWLAYGGGQYAQQANEATTSEQISIAVKVLHSQGPSAWPVSSSRGSVCGF